MKAVINGRQTGMICTVLLLANKVMLLPALLYNEINADGILIVMLLFLVDLLVLWLFFRLKRIYPSASLNEILANHFGKIFAKVLYGVLLTFFLFKVFLTYSIGYMYFKQQVYQEEFALLAVVCFLPVINHACLSGVRSFARTIEFFFYIIIAGIVTSLAISTLSITDMPVVLTTKPGLFFGTYIKHIFSFGDYLFLFLIIDRIKLKKGEGERIFKFSLLGIILVLVLFFLFYSMYQVTAFMHNNALSDILVLPIHYNAIGRLDIISMLTIMFLTFFQLEIYSYAFFDCFYHIFPKLNQVFGIVVFDVLFFTLYFILIGRYEKMVIYTEGWLPYLAILADYIIPLLIYFVTLKRKKLKKERGFEEGENLVKQVSEEKKT